MWGVVGDAWYAVDGELWGMGHGARCADSMWVSCGGIHAGVWVVGYVVCEFRYGV